MIHKTDENSHLYLSEPKEGDNHDGADRRGYASIGRVSKDFTFVDTYVDPDEDVVVVLPADAAAAVLVVAATVVLVDCPATAQIPGERQTFVAGYCEVRTSHTWLTLAFKIGSQYLQRP